jgi:hypothetical protein
MGKKAYSHEGDLFLERVGRKLLLRDFVEFHWCNVNVLPAGGSFESLQCEMWTPASLEHFKRNLACRIDALVIKCHWLVALRHEEKLRDLELLFLDLRHEIRSDLTDLRVDSSFLFPLAKGPFDTIRNEIVRQNLHVVEVRDHKILPVIDSEDAHTFNDTGVKGGRESDVPVVANLTNLFKLERGTDGDGWLFFDWFLGIFLRFIWGNARFEALGRTLLTLRSDDVPLAVRSRASLSWSWFGLFFIRGHG